MRQPDVAHSQIYMYNSRHFRSEECNSLSNIILNDKVLSNIYTYICVVAYLCAYI